MKRIVAGFGAPVTEAQGNRAPNSSGSRASETAVTVEVICQTVG